MANQGICTTDEFIGINSNCQFSPTPYSHVIFAQRGTKFASLSAGQLLTNWETEISENLNMYVAKLLSYEGTGSEATINTTTLGIPIFSTDSKPQAVAYLDMNMCDYNSIQTILKGGIFDIFFVREGGVLDGWIDYDGSINGYPMKVKAHTGGIAIVDAVENTYRVTMLGTEIDTWKRIYLFKTDGTWNPGISLPAAMPEGLSMVTTSAYATGDIDVQVNVRCAEEKESLALADFEVRSNNLDAGVTAIVDNGAGSYTLTVQKDVSTTPANLAAGDVVLVYVKELDGSTVLSISNNVNVAGV